MIRRQHAAVIYGHARIHLCVTQSVFSLLLAETEKRLNVTLQSL